MQCLFYCNTLLVHVPCQCHKMLCRFRHIPGKNSSDRSSSIAFTNWVIIKHFKLNFALKVTTILPQHWFCDLHSKSNHLLGDAVPTQLKINVIYHYIHCKPCSHFVAAFKLCKLGCCDKMTTTSLKWNKHTRNFINNQILWEFFLNMAKPDLIYSIRQLL